MMQERGSGDQSLSGSLLHVLGAGEGTGRVEQIVIGDGVYYANYKAPFEQLEGATSGYPRGELPYDTDGRLLCPYVDRHVPVTKSRTDRPGRVRVHRRRDTFHNLGAHLTKIHHLTAPEFKAEAGLNAGTALVSEQTRYRNSAAAIKRHWGSTGNHDRERLQTIAANRKGHHGRSPQSLNRRNVCYGQVLLTAQQVQQKFGSITQARMRAAGVHTRIIEMHYGSWEAFLKRYGQTVVRRQGHHLADEDLLRDLRSMAVSLGHTPTVSDMRRHQMASRKAYEEHFGSWVEACRLAGIEPNTPSVWSRRAFTVEEDAAVLSAYAMSGSIAKAARHSSMSGARATEILARYGMVPIWNGGSWAQRQEQMAQAADMSRRLMQWPERISA